MKRIQRFLLMAIAPLMAASFSSCTDYQDEIDALDARVTYLESLVKQVNSELESLQIIVSAFESGDVITGITENSEGYIINFLHSDPIFIHHGQDGRNGQDAQMPNITVVQDPTDGNYYWQVNGQWLTDNNGTRIRANGKDGRDGQDGQDGTAPQVRINADGYWEISSDGGITWTNTGTPATGKDGKDGADANAIVKVITHWNEGYVEFVTLSGSFSVPLYIVNG